MVSRFEQFSTAIASIYRNIQKIERAEMAKFGLKGPHCQCLLAMSRYPDGITAARLCAICDKDKAAISRAVAELEEAGMVIRSGGQGKRYRASLKLTAAGMASAQSVMNRARVAVTAATGDYGQEQQNQFTQTLAMLAYNLDQICREGLKEEENGGQTL